MCLLDSDFYSERKGAEYEIVLSAWGEGVLRESALLDMQKPDAILKRFKARYRREPKSVSLLIDDPGKTGSNYRFTGIETALLEKFGTLKELILPDSITKIELTPRLEKILKENGTLIRGPIGSCAEAFARENSLHFRPEDFVFAEYESTRPPETTKLTLVFSRNGDVMIREDISSPGTSCSNTFGGTFTHPLKQDFYMTQSAEEVAGTFGGSLKDEILRDGRLAAFIEKAKTTDFFKGRN